jgi:hypothetical protein
MLQSQMKQTKQETKQDVERIKWAIFTYVGKETRFITKIFKNTNVKVTFTTDNTIENLLVTRHKNKFIINMKNVASTNLHAPLAAWNVLDKV